MHINLSSCILKAVLHRTNSESNGLELRRLTMQRLVVWNKLPIKSAENHLQVHVNGKDFLQFEHT